MTTALCVLSVCGYTEGYKIFYNVPNTNMGTDEQYREVTYSVTSYNAVIMAVVPRLKVSSF